jgi:sialic acid synthase SpsE
MTKLELLAALKSMTISEQLEVLEATSKIIREGLNHKTDLEIAAEKMQAYYAAGSELAAFTDDNNEDFYEYSEYA